MKTLHILPLLGILTAGCTSVQTASERTAPAVGSTVEILPVLGVSWEQLNPARGDKSPEAGTLWGDRKGLVPTGFLARFVDGFSSPPHIHNATYRAVVISGHVQYLGTKDTALPLDLVWGRSREHHLRTHERQV